MKKLSTLLLSLTVATAFAQYPADSGFTKKAEAKNKTENDMKEGKWIEYVDIGGFIVTTFRSIGFTLMR